MPVIIRDSNEARAKWRDVLDSTHAGEDTVIERYGKPIAVVIPYVDYEALLDELDDLRAGRRAQAAVEEWRKDPSLGTPLEQVEAEWRAQGLLE
jgi:prevent-host-death family protein